jgi:hypothetical protein
MVEINRGNNRIMTVEFTNSLESVRRASIDDRDWASLSLSDRIRGLESDGFLLIPDLLDADQLEIIRAELSRLPITTTDYSDKQGGCMDVQWTDSPNAIDVVALPAMIDFLTELFGDEIICTSMGYGVSMPGHPGIAIHTDAQPYGSKILGVQASAPVLARVLYYLDDLTPERSPFKVIPRSHLSMHADANPYTRYLSHDEEVMVTCKAGSAAIINQKVFHGNYPNYSDQDRRMLAIAYRPAWAGPISEVSDRDPERVANLPPHVRKYFRSLNTRSIDFDLPNRPPNMKRSAAGLNPSRWEA